MIDGLKPYPRYTDSGVPWLGEVPADWDVKRNKLFLREVNERSEHGAEELLTVSQYTGVTRRRDRQLEDGGLLTNASSLVGYKRVAPGDLVMNIMLAWNGSLGVSPIEGIVSPAYCVYRAKEGLQPRFFHYLLRTPLFTGAFKTVSTGVVDSRLRLYSDVFFRLPSVLPSPDEQSAIVRFLDHADRRVRHYVRAKQKLIALLNEQKQAIIHRTVTRGLDPNVRLKPSGVEWLGDVPEYWEVVRNGRLFSQRNETGFGELPILEVSLRTGVRVRYFENSTRKQVMSDREKYKRALKGDLAYNMMRMWQGAVGIAPVDGLVSPAYVVIRPFDGVEPRYFSNLFRTATYMSEVDKYSRGIVKDRNRLYWEDFKQIASPRPPFEEQVNI
jgi:type I restriction enzyme S subunit